MGYQGRHAPRVSFWGRRQGKHERQYKGRHRYGILNSLGFGRGILNAPYKGRRRRPG